MTQTAIPVRTQRGFYHIRHICGKPAVLDIGLGGNIRRSPEDARRERDNIAIAATGRPCHECRSAAHWARIDATANSYDQMMANSRGSLGQPYFAEVG